MTSARPRRRAAAVATVTAVPAGAGDSPSDQFVGRRYATMSGADGTGFRGSSGRGSLRGCGCSPRPCPSSARWRSASGSAPARSTSPTTCSAPATSSSTCSSRARRPAARPRSRTRSSPCGGDMNAFTDAGVHGVLRPRPRRPPRGRGRHPLRGGVGAGVPSRRGRLRASGHPRRDPHARRHAGRHRPRALRRRAVPRSTRSGRSVLGTRRHDRRRGPRRRSRRTTTTTTGPPTSSLPRPGTSSTERWSSSIGAGLDVEDGARPARIDPSFAPPEAILTERRATEQAHLVLGVRALARDDPDRYALSVVNQVLGGGMSSRLFQEVREKRGLAYSVYSYRVAFDGTGALGVYAGTSPERVAGDVDGDPR